MRTYYLFKINDTFLDLYKEKSLYIYKMLEQISKSSNSSFMISYRLYEQMIIPYDKDKINNMLENNYMYHRYYRHYLNNHFYNDGVENTKLYVHNTFIKVKTSNNISCFFDDLSTEKNIFVCDFKNKDYFWLNKVLHKTCIK